MEMTGRAGGHGPAAAPGAGGFTLIEVLLVVVVIGILGGIVMSASSYITKVSRDKRYQVTRAVLETAIYRYRDEYGDWPVSAGEETRPDDDGKRKFAGAAASAVFGPLRMGNDGNPDRIQFIDETTVFTYVASNKGKKSKIVPLADVKGGAAMPLVYIDREGKMKYFNVEVDFHYETVTVK